MKSRYLDLIEQTFDWPDESFNEQDGQLYWQNIDLMEVIKQYGTPLKITYLPKISENIIRAKRYFNEAKAKFQLPGLVQR